MTVLGCEVVNTGTASPQIPSRAIIAPNNVIDLIGFAPRLRTGGGDVQPLMPPVFLVLKNTSNLCARCSCRYRSLSVCGFRGILYLVDYARYPFFDLACGLIELSLILEALIVR